MATPYSHKVPKEIRETMTLFTGNNCYLVKRKTDTINESNKAGNCHLNVEHFKSIYGGERITGWLLHRSRDIIEKGIWVWHFHSIWKTNDGDFFDVTDDAIYSGVDSTTVWLDLKRDVDFNEGTNFNSIVIFSNQHSAEALGFNTGYSLSSKTIYWTTKRLHHFKQLHEHNGRYRWLDERYPKNIARLEQEFDCKAVNGKLIPNNPANNSVNPSIFFDYGLG